MLSSAIHILTLLAFSTHAVFGCCGHHQHAGQIDCCHSNREHVISKVDATSAKVCSHHCCSHAVHDVAGDENISLPPFELAQSTADDVQADECCCSGTPCDHSNGCNEARCTYVASGWKSLDSTSNIGVVIGFTYKLTDNVIVLASIVSHDNIADSGGKSPSAANRCAHLQSWQI